MAITRPSGRLLVIGGAEDRAAAGPGLLHAFAELAGGTGARIVLVTTASGTPGNSFARYSAAFRELGVPAVRELRLADREDADDDRTRTELSRATGVFFSGGDQGRLGVLVGSRANRCLQDRFGAGTLVIAGTSAGATVMGETMILGGSWHPADGGATVSGLRTGPGLGLLPGVIVDMHFTERRRLPRLLAAVLRQPSQVGLGIDEDTAVLVSPGRFEVLGRGTVTTVDARAAPAAGPAPGPGEGARFHVRLHRLYAGDAFRLRQRADRPLHDVTLYIRSVLAWSSLSCLNLTEPTAVSSIEGEIYVICAEESRPESRSAPDASIRWRQGRGCHLTLPARSCTTS